MLLGALLIVMDGSQYIDRPSNTKVTTIGGGESVVKFKTY
jgi:hypothetical protein